MNTDKIKEIVQIFESSKLHKMELEIDNMKLKMEKEPKVKAVAIQQEAPQSIQTTSVESAPVKETAKEEKASGTWVKAPLVGTFYNSRTQGGTPLVEIGQHVKKGETLCIIEAMKVMNEIPSPVDGIVQEIVVTNESMVEYDQELIRIGDAA
ncbi:acetyl-CoA carboxylase biotin carboxyl carrier protein [Erysipelotrichaceae bacterium HCN-30851]